MSEKVLPHLKKKEVPLPWEFYNYRGWYSNVLKFYADEQGKLPRKLLESPVKALIVAVRDVIDVYGNFPVDTAKALEYSINPLYEPGEYRSKVYEPLKQESLEKSDSNLMFMADGLLAIRAFFEEDHEMLQDRFAKEIELVEVADGEEKAEKFSSVMRDITRTHVNQIVKLIKEFIVKSK